MSKSKAPRAPINKLILGGAHAVLGMDIVAFSRLHDDDQVQVVGILIRWINEALAYHSIGEDDYRWSPAGDGGYLTFASPAACRKAIDVSFSISEKLQRPDWRPRSGEKIRLRMALHAGMVQEARELGRQTNIWGMGINMAARILSVAAPSQLLVSKQYFDTYIKGERESDFEIGDLHWRTVKHGVQLEVMNIGRHDLGLKEQEATTRRWQAIGGLWQKTVQEYTFLIHDTMKSGEPVAALAASRFLLDLRAEDAVWELCHMIGQSDVRPSKHYPARTHPLFSQMPPDVLFHVIQVAAPRPVRAGQVICEQGDKATSCFFPVAGVVAVEIPGQDNAIPIPIGQIIGEFSLWIPNILRTARLRALDDGLLLEIDNDRFREVLATTPNVADVVYSIIRRRILENVLRSRGLFPDVSTTMKQDLSRIPVSCEKFAVDTELGLDSSAYVLVSGKVRIQLQHDKSLDINASGVFGAEPVVGIVCDLGSPDGNRATVLQETVGVVVPHETLRELQKRFDSVRRAWDRIYGERLGEMKRITT